VSWTPDTVPGDNSGFYTITIPINNIGNTTQQSTTITVTAFDSNGSNQSISATTKDSANLPNTKAPAGTAGEPINLALTSSAAAGTSIMTTINNLPTGWTIPGATQNADGSWTVITTNLESLTVTTAAGFVGALLLTGTMDWLNANGTMEFSPFSDNVEAYAPGSPIFALSGADTLTGAGGNDLFVFAQPIGNDVIYNFNVASDVVDLVNFSGVGSFSNIQLTNDANGNAVITLSSGETITLKGVAAASLTANNFVFNQTPVTNNTGTMTIGDGALLPLSGIINNSGTIALNSTGDLTVLQISGAGITLQGGGTLTLSDSTANSIVGTTSTTTLTNVDNTISGAGQIGSGDGTLTLVNEAKGTIDANVAGTLTLDTGHTIVNAGLLEANNSGTLLIVDGVSGGTATIAGGTLVFDAQSNVNVTFNNGTGTPTYGELVLADAPAFSGQIFGFTGTAPGVATSDAIDVTDINFAKLTTETYTLNSAGTGGTLLVSDGTNTATINFSGNYTLASFNFASDGQGGTLITDPPPDSTTPTSTSTDSSSTPISTDSALITTSMDSSSTDDPLPSQTLQNAAGPGPADLPTSGTLPQQAWDNAASQLFGADSRLSAGKGLDLPDIAFGANTTLGYSPNASGTGGTLSVSDATHTATIALFGQYAAAGFQLGSDQNNGALVTCSSPLVSENNVLITNPKHKS
jgi:hypothetical protein